MVADTKPKVIYLKDYEPSSFLIESAFLHFDLQPEETQVKSVLKFYRNPEAKNFENTLSLNGEELRLKRILMNGKSIAQDHYIITENELILLNVPDVFTLETEVIIHPEKNKALSGLYQSRGNYCTQCEAQGFRRITYFLDRPDVLTYFTTTITADQDRYPVLLSNGNLIDSKILEHNRRWVMWEDPSLKPCYLFALVAGDYEFLQDGFTTESGRLVELRLYVEKGNLGQAEYGMQCLKRAMRWDETTYHREYDLDIYMIVAVSDFNMGAMENKGLNLFNDKYILAKPETATDDDYVAIESVIGHEYFHNWSGNRVTVKNWFQITLKEGLTIFRDQNFTADMTSKDVKRIKDVNVIRNYQFPQDAGPMAHPIRPESYIEVNNFYTVTVYNKGAEVIRMIETILGRKTFLKAMDLYFTKYDGKAVTTEDFVGTMEEASGIDLQQFRRWYSQAGTPHLEVKDEYDEEEQRYRITFKQTCPPTPGQPVKENFHIPVLTGFLDDEGNEVILQSKTKLQQSNNSILLNVTESAQTFEFINVQSRPLPSLLRNFSAPVKLHYPYTDEKLIFLMKHDTDGFNAWDAGYQLAVKIILKMIEDYQQDKPFSIPDIFVSAFENMLSADSSDKLFLAEKLTLPAESYLIDLMEIADVEGMYWSRFFMRKHLAGNLSELMLKEYHKNNDASYELTNKSMGSRRIKNLLLYYLISLENQEVLNLCLEQVIRATNMTDEIGALAALNFWDSRAREEALERFYEKWQHEPLVIDKWFVLHAMSPAENTLQTVRSLLRHPAFDIKNPNKVRSLIGTFCSLNYLRFHDKTGEGYSFLAEQVLDIDTFNPQLAARIIEPLIRWRKYDKHRQDLMRTQLERIASAKKLSNDVYEIVTKSLT